MIATPPEDDTGSAKLPSNNFLDSSTPAQTHTQQRDQLSDGSFAAESFFVAFRNNQVAKCSPLSLPATFPPVDSDFRLASDPDIHSSTPGSTVLTHRSNRTSHSMRYSVSLSSCDGSPYSFSSAETLSIPTESPATFARQIVESLGNGLGARRSSVENNSESPPPLLATKSEDSVADSEDAEDETKKMAQEASMLELEMDEDDENSDPEEEQLRICVGSQCEVKSSPMQSWYVKKLEISANAEDYDDDGMSPPPPAKSRIASVLEPNQKDFLASEMFRKPSSSSGYRNFENAAKLALLRKSAVSCSPEKPEFWSKPLSIPKSNLSFMPDPFEVLNATYYGSSCPKPVHISTLSTSLQIHDSMSPYNVAQAEQDRLYRLHMDKVTELTRIRTFASKKDSIGLDLRYRPGNRAAFDELVANGDVVMSAAGEVLSHRDVAEVWLGQSPVTTKPFGIQPQLPHSESGSESGSPVLKKKKQWKRMLVLAKDTDDDESEEVASIESASTCLVLTPRVRARSGMTERRKGNSALGMRREHTVEKHVRFATDVVIIDASDTEPKSVPTTWSTCSAGRVSRSSKWRQKLTPAADVSNFLGADRGAMITVTPLEAVVDVPDNVLDNFNGCGSWIGFFFSCFGIQNESTRIQGESNQVTVDAPLLAQTPMSSYGAVPEADRARLQRAVVAVPKGATPMGRSALKWSDDESSDSSDSDDG